MFEKLTNLTPIAQKLKPIVHSFSASPVEQLEQPADDNTYLKLIGHDYAGVHPVSLEVFGMQLNKVAPVEGKDSTVLGNRKGQLVSIGQTNLFGFIGGQNIDLPGAENAEKSQRCTEFFELYSKRICSVSSVLALCNSV